MKEYKQLIIGNACVLYNVEVILYGVYLIIKVLISKQQVVIICSFKFNCFLYL